MEPRPLRLNPGTNYLAAEVSRLAKVPLCLMVAASAAFGYLLYGRIEYLPLIQVTAGLFFLACGAAAVNSIQERELDALYQGRRYCLPARGTYSIDMLHYCRACLAAAL